MPFRKLGRFGSWAGSAAQTSMEEDCGSEAVVSGGIADPLGTGTGSAQQEGGQQQAQPSPSQQPKKQQNTIGQIGGGGRSARPSRKGLEQAAGEVITALHGAKQELAKEMEANLKQLKAILQDTQRIAKEMEAILKEAKADPSPQQMSRGTGQTSWDPPASKQKARQQQAELEQVADQQVAQWHPPDLKQQPH